MASTSQPDPFALDTLLPLYIDSSNAAHAAVLTDQLTHRTHLIRDVWRIPPGSRVLEIGCGQGDCTLVLAAAVGEEGSVVGVDPADLSYGSPYTLGQAQAHLASGPLGSRMTFVQSDPEDYLASATTPPFTHVVLVHSLWYFSAPNKIASLLSLLTSLQAAGRIERICIAEWSLSSAPAASILDGARPASDAPSPSSHIPRYTHVLAALTRGQLEAARIASGAPSSANVRSCVSPAWVRSRLSALGVALRAECVVAAPVGMRDAVWETQGVLEEEFERDVERVVGDEGRMVALLGMRDAVRASVGVEGGNVGEVRCMGVWCCVF